MPKLRSVCRRVLWWVLGGDPTDLSYDRPYWLWRCREEG